MDFSSGPAGNKSSMDTEKQLQLVQQTVQTEIIVKLLGDMTDRCYKKCISKPGTSLDNYQKKCLAHCMDRYMESQEMIEKSYTKRLLQEGGH